MRYECQTDIFDNKEMKPTLYRDMKGNRLALGILCVPNAHFMNFLLNSNKVLLVFCVRWGRGEGCGIADVVDWKI